MTHFNVKPHCDEYTCRQCGELKLKRELCETIVNDREYREPVAVPANGLDPWWVTGFSDGDACFYAHISDWLDKDYHINIRKDDRPLLWSILAAFGCRGRIFDRKNLRWKSAVAGAKPQASLRIQDSDALLDNVIKHFDSYSLKTKKLSSYLLWREALVTWNAELRGRKFWAGKYYNVYTHIIYICDNLSKSKQYNNEALCIL